MKIAIILLAPAHLLAYNKITFTGPYDFRLKTHKAESFVNTYDSSRFTSERC